MRLFYLFVFLFLGFLSCNSDDLTFEDCDSLSFLINQSYDVNIITFSDLGFVFGVVLTQSVNGEIQIWGNSLDQSMSFARISIENEVLAQRPIGDFTDAGIRGGTQLSSGEVLLHGIFRTFSGTEIWVEKFTQQGEYAPIYFNVPEVNLLNVVYPISENEFISVGSYSTEIDLVNTSQIQISKKNDAGENFWTKYLENDLSERAHSITHDDAGHILLLYTSGLKSTDKKLKVTKFDSQGNEIWDKTILDNVGISEHKIISDEFGDLLVMSSTTIEDINVVRDQDITIIKLDANGNEIWQQSYGGDRNDNAQDFIQTQDGGLAILGDLSTCSNGLTDILVMKLNIQGELEWANVYGNTHYEIGKSIIQRADGGYALLGLSDGGITENNNWAMIYMRLDADGVPE